MEPVRISAKYANHGLRIGKIYLERNQTNVVAKDAPIMLSMAAMFKKTRLIIPGT